MSGNEIPHTEHDLVLAGAKAEPSGWPTASLDPSSGRGPRTVSGSPLPTIQQIQVSTDSGDCQSPRALICRRVAH
jgi:hypothetical protein